MRVDLDELERLEKAAFCAPWEYHLFEIECPAFDRGGEDCGYDHNVARVESPNEYPDGQVIADINVPGLETFASRNGALIAATRNALPAIIAELRAARECTYILKWASDCDALRNEDEDMADLAVEKLAAYAATKGDG